VHGATAKNRTNNMERKESKRGIRLNAKKEKKNACSTRWREGLPVGKTIPREKKGTFWGGFPTKGGSSGGEERILNEGGKGEQMHLQIARALKDRGGKPNFLGKKGGIAAQKRRGRTKRGPSFACKKPKKKKKLTPKRKNVLWPGGKKRKSDATTVHRKNKKGGERREVQT